LAADGVLKSALLGARGYWSAYCEIACAGKTTRGGSFDGQNKSSWVSGLEAVESRLDANRTNYAHRINENHVLRAGWTNTIARPNYAHLVPFESIPDEANELDDGSTIDIGNPDLKSQRSRNLDLSYEWYFQPVGLFTVAAFQKDIDKFSYQSIRNEIRLVDAADEGQPPDIVEVPVRIRSQRNGADARLRGVEISWQHQLSFLPSPLDGLGFNANYTLTEGRSRIPDDLTGGFTTLDYMFRQAEDVRNFQVYYEKYRFNVRVGQRYNAGWNQNVSDTGNVVVNPTTYWDASVRYNLTKNFTLYVEAKNFTKELLTWYFMTPETPTEWQIPDYGYRGGVRFRF
jgi:TonB-dependent receptor